VERERGEREGEREREIDSEKKIYHQCPNLLNVYATSVL
jgi:hypothetical protein